MLQGVLAEARIHGVAVREERLATKFLHKVGNSLGVIGTQVTDVPQLPEMHFDGDEFAVHVDVGNPGPAGQTLQLGRQALPESLGAEVCVIYLGFFHISEFPIKVVIFGDTYKYHFYYLPQLVEPPIN